MAEAKVSWQPNNIFTVVFCKIHLTAAFFQTSTLPNLEQNSSKNKITLLNKLQLQNANKSGITATNFFQSKLKSNHAVKPTVKMAPRNAHFENQIEVYRRARRCLVARNINFGSTRAQFETSVRARLTKGGSVTFFWPPSTDVRFRHNKKRHQGYVFLGFETRADARLAEQDLQNYVFSGRAVNVFRASREAFVPGCEQEQATSAPATAASTAATTTAPPPPPSTAVTTTTTTPPPAATNRDPSDSAEESRLSWW
ncbi:hypothetical protein GGI35DRAFT_476948 [Trichoderma velutinum]